MKSKDITQIAILAALYAVAGLIPISVFIGAPSFLGLNLIITPVIAIMLSPFNAFLTAIIGGIISLYVAPSQAMFGVLSVSLPVIGAFFGSVAYHHKRGGIVSAFFLFVATALYLIKNIAFFWFIIPHLVAALMVLIYPLINTFRFRTSLYVYVSTMCEQGIMMIFAAWMLGLPSFVFATILPLMLYERLVATIGGTIIALTIAKIMNEDHDL